MKTKIVSKTSKTMSKKELTDGPAFANATVLGGQAANKKKVIAGGVKVDGLELYAEIDAIIKAATALRATLGGDLKSNALDVFVDNIIGGASGSQSFTAIEGEATGNFQMKKRSTSSPLSDEEESVLTSARVRVEKTVVQQGLFAFNPKYAGDMKLLKDIEKALRVFPKDLIVVQPEVSKAVVTDSTFAEVCRKIADKKCDRSVIEVVTSLAIKPTISDPDLGAIFSKVSKMTKALKAAMESQKAEKAAAKSYS